MAYEAEKDEVIFLDSVESDHPSGQQYIEFKVCRYNGAEPKLQLTRGEDKGNGKTYHKKLGRLTRGEIERLRDKLTELLDIDLDSIETPRLQDKSAAEADDRRVPSPRSGPAMGPDGQQPRRVDHVDGVLRPVVECHECRCCPVHGISLAYNSQCDCGSESNHRCVRACRRGRHR